MAAGGVGWAAQAVKAGHTAGLQVPGLEGCYSNITKGMLVQYDSAYGGFGYTSPSHSGLSGVGALCMQLVGDYAWRNTPSALRISVADAVSCAAWLSP